MAGNQVGTKRNFMIDVGTIRSRSCLEIEHIIQRLDELEMVQNAMEGSVLRKIYKIYEENPY